VEELRSWGPAPCAVAIGENRYASGSRVRRPGTATGYSVALPTSGACEITHRGRAVDADADTAVVAASDEDVDMRCGDGFWFYSVRIEDGVLEDALEHRLGRAVGGPLMLDAKLDLRAPAGRAWSQAVRLLASSPLADQPLLAAPAREAVVGRLLFAVEHGYRDELDAPVHSWGPGPVHRMVDAIEATPRHPFTLAELSDIAGVSVRALGACCRRHLDASPGERLRAVRLSRAHDELATADAGWTSPVAVVSGWGFADMGRFTADYVGRYREPPWLTLRGPAYA
jgi:AraC-like DNA-binding protein